MSSFQHLQPHPHTLPALESTPDRLPHPDCLGQENLAPPLPLGLGLGHRRSQSASICSFSFGSSQTSSFAFGTPQTEKKRVSFTPVHHRTSLGPATGLRESTNRVAEGDAQLASLRLSEFIAKAQQLRSGPPSSSASSASEVTSPVKRKLDQYKPSVGNSRIPRPASTLQLFDRAIPHPNIPSPAEQDLALQPTPATPPRPRKLDQYKSSVGDSRIPRPASTLQLFDRAIPHPNTASPAEQDPGLLPTPATPPRPSIGFSHIPQTPDGHDSIFDFYDDLLSPFSSPAKPMSPSANTPPAALSLPRSPPRGSSLPQSPVRRQFSGAGVIPALLERRAKRRVDAFKIKASQSGSPASPSWDLDNGAVHTVQSLSAQVFGGESGIRQEDQPMIDGERVGPSPLRLEGGNRKDAEVNVSPASTLRQVDFGLAAVPEEEEVTSWQDGQVESTSVHVSGLPRHADHQRSTSSSSWTTSSSHNQQTGGFATAVQSPDPFTPLSSASPVRNGGFGPVQSSPTSDAPGPSDQTESHSRTPSWTEHENAGMKLDEEIDDALQDWIDMSQDRMNLEVSDVQTQEEKSTECAAGGMSVILGREGRDDDREGSMSDEKAGSSSAHNYSDPDTSLRSFDSSSVSFSSVSTEAKNYLGNQYTLRVLKNSSHALAAELHVPHPDQPGRKLLRVPSSSSSSLGSGLAYLSLASDEPDAARRGEGFDSYRFDSYMWQNRWEKFRENLVKKGGLVYVAGRECVKGSRTEVLLEELARTGRLEEQGEAVERDWKKRRLEAEMNAINVDADADGDDSMITDEGEGEGESQEAQGDGDGELHRVSFGDESCEIY